MLPFIHGELTKMHLEGYLEPTYKTLTGFSCEVQVNPESYSLDQAVSLSPEAAQGTAGTAAAFLRLNPRKLSFEVVFDATGALSDNAVSGTVAKRLLGGKGIQKQFEAFRDTICKYVGDNHRTPYVKIKWGALTFFCQLETFNANFKLFSPSGVPLRATVKVAFVEALDDTKLSLMADALSADLTHLRTVQAGDTLPLLCEQIYGNPALYPQVARANGLSNLRTLRVGQELTFPPLVPADQD